MKQWVKNLVEQFGLDWETKSPQSTDKPTLSEEKASILYLIDTLNKYLVDIEGRPVRQVRVDLDSLAKAIGNADPAVADKAMFRFRQYFNSYRIDEYTYIQNTFDDFKNVIWDFADQLSEDIEYERSQDHELGQSLELLKDAVESNSIDDLRSRSREFIDTYVEAHTQKESRRSRRMNHMQKNLAEVQTKLTEATKSAKTDHLTGAWNRRSFDDKAREIISEFKNKNTPCTMLMLDIDYFKRVNDVYGHDVGDYVLQECVRMLKQIFSRPKDFVARVGGEEFVVLLPSFRVQDSIKKVEEALQAFRDEVIIYSDQQISFTCSIGVAQLLDSENKDQWVKRADEALYKSKKNGRDRYTVAPNATGVENVA